MRIILIPIGLLILGFAFLSLSNCNAVAKQIGGTVTVKLPPNTKMVNVTWKEDNLWVVQRPKNKDESCNTTYTFQEYSNYGIFQGRALIVESEK